MKLSKKELRKQFFKSFLPEDILPQRKLKKNLYIYLNSKPKDLKGLKIMAYDPFPTEPSILKILRELGIKNVYLPFTCGRCIRSRSEKYPLWMRVSQMDLIIVPALRVQKNGFRLGRGRGFYDRMLSFYDFRKAIFLGYDWQIQEQFPIEKHDRRVSTIITETKVINCYY